jgi:hypothetical protein
MNATLYLPEQLPQKVPADGFVLPDAMSGFVQVPAQVSELLGCLPGLVDILASGPGYVAYSVFDSEEKVNHAAMVAVAEASGIEFDEEDEDMTLRGAILLILAV